MTRRILTLALTFMMVLAVFAGVFSAGAAEVVTGGVCGDNVTWTLTDDGTLTISGTGDMSDWVQNVYGPWYANRGTIKTVVIEDGVTSIGDYAFCSCSKLTGVRIPGSVTSIGRSAFANCAGLTEIVIPEGVTTIGWNAFERCSKLTAITLPKTLKNIGLQAFSGCTILEAIVIPEGVTSIAGYTFQNCYDLTDVTIPESVTLIASGAFKGCRLLINVFFSGSKEQWNAIQVDTENDALSNAVIHYNGNMTPVIIGTGTCGESLTWTLSSDRILTISGTGKMLNWHADIEYCDTPWARFIGKIRTVVIEEGVTNIGFYAFSYCENLTSVTIPKSVTSIGIGAFYTNIPLTDIYYAGSKAQWGAISIDRNNPQLVPATVHYNGKTGAGVAEGEFGDGFTWVLTDESELVISGKGKMPDWSDFSSVPWNAYSDQIQKVTIEEGVTNVGSNAFRDCSALTGASIPVSMTSIGVSAFSACAALKNVYYAGSEEQWAALAKKEDNAPLSDAVVHYHGFTDEVIFRGTCGDHLTWTLEDNGLLTISGKGKMADWHCDWSAYIHEMPWDYLITNIRSIVIENGVTSIGACAFSACSNLESIVIPESVTSIGTHAFEYCTKLDAVTIPEGVTSIGTYAFYNCSSLTSVAIPESVKTIWNYAFSGCESLSVVEYAGTKTQWGEITIKAGNAELLKDTEIHYNGVEKYIPGDVDKNGQVNTTDVILVRRYIAGGYDVQINENAADVDGNGQINTTDVILMRRAIAGGYGVVLQPGNIA